MNKLLTGKFPSEEKYKGALSEVIEKATYPIRELPGFRSGNPSYFAAALLFPTLYLGNYLGIRNSLPWGRTDRKWLEVIRIGTGAVLSCIVVIILVSIAAAILHF